MKIYLILKPIVQIDGNANGLRHRQLIPVKRMKQRLKTSIAQGLALEHPDRSPRWRALRLAIVPSAAPSATTSV